MHDRRHYKKLCPHLPHHRQIPEDFRKKYWDYYRELLVYKEKPGADEAERLSQKFDKLFSQQTG